MAAASSASSAISFSYPYSTTGFTGQVKPFNSTSPPISCSFR